MQLVERTFLSRGAESGNELLEIRILEYLLKTGLSLNVEGT